MTDLLVFFKLIKHYPTYLHKVIVGSRACSFVVHIDQIFKDFFKVTEEFPKKF